MALSRLENFIKNVEGNILYVNPNDLDSTDDISNQGNSLTRPFKTIQRALLESARFSYQIGLGNDKFDKTTIMLYPGEHIVDNRPGYSIDSDGTIKDVNGIVRTLPEFTGISIFDLNNVSNELYKYNSIHGGVIIPRGTSVVGMDLRKTKIRPKYVPDPRNPNIDNSAIFRVTGGCYFWQFSIFDGSKTVYKDNQSEIYAPDYSHHKLTCFEYADGVNLVKDKGLTDLQMYYHKLTKAYGDASGRKINEYPSNSDFEPRIQESKIVGPLGAEVGISSIFAGNGVTPSTSVTVVTSDPHNLEIDSPIRINGADSGNSPVGYDGLFLVSGVNSETEFKYTSSTVPTPSFLEPTSANVNVEVDTVTGASPYIFNISMRSVFGMQGLHADGDKSTGFKSMVVAQFTGISLQKDDLAFVKYNETTGLYDDQGTLGNSSILHLDSRAIYKPEYENTHIKISNDAIVQAVSIFAIGYSKHFECINGGDISLTNSNSNFGATALASRGFRRKSFDRDNRGFITGIVPSQALVEDNSPIIKCTYNIDAVKTRTIANSSRLYLHGYKSETIPPLSSFDDYKIGANREEKLYALISIGGTASTYESSVIMDVPSTSTNEIVSSKQYFVNRVFGNNDINSSTYSITLAQDHDIITGEKIRIYSENGSLPDGLDHNQIYYAIRVSDNEIKVAPGLDEANGGNPLTLNNKGGRLRVISNVSDKVSGDIGHPVQWDGINNQWYINSSGNNEIYSAIIAGNTPDVITKVSIARKKDFRRNKDLSYKVRYVIPKEETDARIPLDSFNIQESSTTGNHQSAILTSASQSKNDKFISTCTYSGGIVSITTEKAHNLEVGSKIIVNKVKSTVNTVGTANSGFNGRFTVTGISSDLTFTYSLEDYPGEMTNITSNRDSELPNFEINEYNSAFSVYSTEVLKEYKPLVSDGVYHITIVDNSVEPDINYFNNGEYRFSQSTLDLIPRSDNDNPIDDFVAAVSYAKKDQIGTVVTNDPKRSISKESTSKFLLSSGRVGNISRVDVDNIVLGKTFDGQADRFGSIVSVTTQNGHKFGSLGSIGISTGGSNYVPGTYYGVRIVGPSTTSGATAKVIVGASGTVSNISIMDGGSAYGIGHTCKLEGIPRSSSGFVGIVSVNNGDVLSEVGTSFEISGVRNVTSVGITTISSLNGSHKLLDIVDSNTFRYTTKTSVATTETEVYSGYVSPTGPSIAVTCLYYGSSVGIVTVGCGETHGLSVGNRVRIVGIESFKSFKGEDGLSDSVVTTRDELFYDNYFIVDTIGVGASNYFTAVGKKGQTDIKSFTGITTAFMLKTAYASQSGLPTIEDEKLSERQSSVYTGINKNIVSNVASSNAILNVNDTKGLYKGDFIQIKDEIMRVADEPTTTTLNVIRGQLGTDSKDYPMGEVLRKISPIPVELRRPSIIRASGHTFEYLGFGPGNYSTALPQRQDRVRAEKEIINSQSRVSFGGVAVYTGMNDSGDFYIGNKRIISPTGEEVVVDTPFPADASENEISRLKIDTDDVLVSKRLRVEGGFDQQSASSFGGPVVFSNSISVLGESGIQADNLNLSGNLDQPRKIAMSETKPSIDGKVGDFVFNAIPISGQFAGWTYTTSGSWNRFGLISTSGDSNTINVDDATVGNLTVTGTIIGTGNISGNITGDGSGLTNLNASNITSGTIDDARIPSLDASKITSGTIDDARIPNLNASKITGGTFASARIPNLNASKITSGTISDDRLPATITSNISGNVTGTASQADNINIDESNSNSNYQVTFSAQNNGGYNRQYIDSDNSHLVYNPATATLSGLNISASSVSGNGSGLSSLNASNITSGTIPSTARIPSLDASKITSGTFVDARIPNLNASKITSGTFVDARIPNLNASKITSGTISVARLPDETPNFFTNTIKITSTPLAADNKVYVSQGLVWYYTTAEGFTVAPSIQYSSGVGMNNYMQLGDVIHIKLIRTVNGNNQYLFDSSNPRKDLKVNNLFVTTYYHNGRPNSSSTSGVDVYDITLYRIGISGNASDYRAIVSQSKCPEF